MTVATNAPQGSILDNPEYAPEKIKNPVQEIKQCIYAMEKKDWKMAKTNGLKPREGSPFIIFQEVEVMEAKKAGAPKEANLSVFIDVPKAVEAKVEFLRCKQLDIIITKGIKGKLSKDFFLKAKLDARTVWWAGKDQNKPEPVDESQKLAAANPENAKQDEQPTQPKGSARSKGSVKTEEEKKLCCAELISELPGCDSTEELQKVSKAAVMLLKAGNPIFAEFKAKFDERKSELSQPPPVTPAVAPKSSVAPAVPKPTVKAPAPVAQKRTAGDRSPIAGSAKKAKSTTAAEKAKAKPEKTIDTAKPETTIDTAKPEKTIDTEMTSAHDENATDSKAKAAPAAAAAKEFTSSFTPTGNYTCPPPPKLADCPVLKVDDAVQLPDIPASMKGNDSYLLDIKASFESAASGIVNKERANWQKQFTDYKVKAQSSVSEFSTKQVPKLQKQVTDYKATVEKQIADYKIEVDKQLADNKIKEEQQYADNKMKDDQQFVEYRSAAEKEMTDYKCAAEKQIQEMKKSHEDEIAKVKANAEASSKNDEKVQELEKQIADMTEKASEYDTLKAEHDKVKAEHDKVTAECTKVTAEYTKVTAEITEVTEKLAAANKLKESMQLELDEVKNDLEMSQLESQTAQAMVEKLKKANDIAKRRSAGSPPHPKP